MEVIGKGPPPLPPKMKKPIQAKDNESRRWSCQTGKTVAPENRFEVDSLKIINKRHRNEDVKPPPQESNKGEKHIEDGRTELARYTKETFITWTGRKKTKESEELYENVSNGGINYLENRSKTIEDKEGDDNIVKKETKKTPKIEVRQEDNKTVVKISIKDITPEGDMNGDDRFGHAEDNLYENGYQQAHGFKNFVYASYDKSKDDGVIYENANVLMEVDTSNGCYENVPTCQQFYANMSENVQRGRGPKKELTTEANYSDLNECDRVYENGEFRITKSNFVSVIGHTETPTVKNKERNDESYENVTIESRRRANEVGKNVTKVSRQDETAEKYERRKTERVDTEKKSSVVEVILQQPKGERRGVGDRSKDEDVTMGDAFDSGTSSDVDSLPNLAQIKRGNVIVTIKSLQSEDKDDKKVEFGHGRAESLTSSGLGVDSEESDDEKSNISCDSLNSSEHYPQSNSEDYGYHTPNSEDKTGSPIDQMEYENVIKQTERHTKESRKQEIELDDGEDYSKTEDIIQQVANVSQKIKNLQTENSGVYLAKLIESTDLEEYENVHVFGKNPFYKKKTPPPPPPAKPSLLTIQTFSDKAEEGDNMKSLPKNLLQDIRSRSVRLSSTYPNGEKPEEVKTSVTAAVFNLETNSRKGTTVKKLKKAKEIKRLMVDERTYEERKTETKRVKVNKICAMEVDTDKFYKFHLAENVRNNAKEEGNGNEEETFAGVKDFLSREKPAAITSAKGTIRGVKNRVKAGIATFLQLHENKSYKDRDAGKVVVYTTTMGIVRETYHKCLKVKQILRTLLVKFEERDVFMSTEAQEEIRERMKCDVILVPQVFVEGQHIGDAETIERLNEMGELRTILKPYKSADACSTCKVCGGYRLLPCKVCKGSKKSIHRNHFTAEFVALKCMNCDQVGLTKCHAC